MHPEQTSQYAITPPARSRRLPVLVAAVVGLVVGGGGVGLGWVLSSGGGRPDDIATACDIVTGLGPPRDLSSDAGFAQQNRLSAAYGLSMAASTTDGQYKQLSDLLQKAVNGIATTFRIDNPTTVRALSQATDFCGGH